MGEGGGGGKGIWKLLCLHYNRGVDPFFGWGGGKSKEILNFSARSVADIGLFYAWKPPWCTKLPSGMTARKNHTTG